MDTYAKAAVATQEIILDAVDELNIPMDEFMNKMELDEIDTMLSEPCLSYYQFLKACAIIKKPAGEVFSLTKKKLTEKKQQDKQNKQDDGNPPAGEIGHDTWKDVDFNEGDDDIEIPDEVDSKAAGISPSGDFLMKWSAVCEAMAASTKRDIEKIRGLFDGAPRIVSDNEIQIVLKNKKSEKMALKLIREGMETAGVLDADKLNVMFADA